MPDPFLESMTFASAKHTRFCDCDECDLIEIPAPIREAMQRKRQEMPLRRTQERSLVRREQGITVWELTMPVDAEPLVEFGSSHRLVWLKRLVGDGKIQSIGTGIIGSSDEEKSRKDLDWNEGSFYLVPSNGGKAIGWIHTTNKASSASSNDNEKNDNEGGDERPTGPAVFQIVKIPADKLLSTDGNEPETAEDEEQHWTQCFSRLCLKVFIENTDSEKKKPRYYVFGEDDSSILRKAFRQAAEQDNKLPAASHTVVPQPKIGGPA